MIVLGIFIALLVVAASGFGPELVLDIDASSTNSSILEVYKSNEAVLPNIRYLRIKRSNLTTFDQKYFQSLANLEECDLSMNKITHFEPGTFKFNKWLRKLVLSDNNIDSITNISAVLSEAPLNESLIELRLSSNRLDNLTEFPTVSNLNYLSLLDNQLPTVDGSVFKNLKNLVNLDFTANSITRIEPRSFEFAKNYTLDIDLSFNRIVNITDALDGFMGAEINSISLRGNLIKEMKVLGAGTSLKSLSIDYNQIEYLNESYFANVNNLEEININSNRIQSIQPAAFSSFKSTFSLSLAGNEMKTLDSISGLKASLIGKLNLDNNQIKTLQKFPEMPFLTHLSLRNNFIEALNESYFLDCNSLSRIELGNNMIKRIDANSFKTASGGITCLSVLLDYNLVEDLDDVLPGLNESSMCEISLYSNRLKELKVFPPLKNLQNLSLEYNKIAFINSSFFRNLPSLSRLDLGWNSISDIPDEFIRSVPNLKRLVLRANNLSRVPSVRFLSGNSLQEFDVANQAKGISQLDDFAFERLKPSNLEISNRLWFTPWIIDLSYNNILNYSSRTFCSHNSNGLFVRKIQIDVESISRMSKCLLKQLRMTPDQDAFFQAAIEIEILPSFLTNISLDSICGCSEFNLYALKFNILLTGVCSQYSTNNCSSLDLGSLEKDCQDYDCLRIDQNASASTTTDATTPEPTSIWAITIGVIGAAVLFVVAFAIPIFLRPFSKV